MKRALNILFGFFLFASHAFAQQDSTQVVVKDSNINASQKPFSDVRFDDRMIYKYAMMGGLGIHTSGFNLYFRKQFNKDWYKSRFWQIGFSSMRHPKEVKINPFEGDAKAYVFGKMNSLSVLRFVYGHQKLLFEKEAFKGVHIGYTVLGGFSLGLAKPVYLEVEEPFVTGQKPPEIVVYDSAKHDLTKIIGRAPFTYGLSEIKPYPGAHLKAGLFIDYSSDYVFLRTIELGVQLDAFYKNVPIMAFTQNKFLFFNLYLAWHFGKRYNTL